jgi:hypothetical protein
MAENNKVNQFLRDYSLLVGILVVCSLLLFGMVSLTRPSWRNGLKTQLQSVFDRIHPGEYVAGGDIPLNSNLDASSAVFELLTPEANVAELLGNPVPAKQYGIIMRMPTIFGPLPGIFRVDGDGGVHFVGFAFHFARYEEQFSKSLFYPRIGQFETRVQKLLEATSIGPTNVGAANAARRDK